jgi:hypothetical protein
MLLARRQLEYIIFRHISSHILVFLCVCNISGTTWTLLPSWVLRISKIKFSIKFKIRIFYDRYFRIFKLIVLCTIKMPVSMQDVLIGTLTDITMQ